MNRQPSQPPQGWPQLSNLILILSIIGIVCLTFFPFRFDFANPHFSNTSPFFLCPSLKHGVGVDFFLNVLLFVPFGFGLSEQVRRRGVTRLQAMLFALAAGAITSYTVELLQFYIPTRSSAWDDVTPNTLGAVFGCLLFNRWGEAALKYLTAWEER